MRARRLSFVNFVANAFVLLLAWTQAVRLADGGEPPISIPRPANSAGAKQPGHDEAVAKLRAFDVDVDEIDGGWSVSVLEEPSSSPKLDLGLLQSVHGLRAVYLSGGLIDDASLEHLRGLPHLEKLFIVRTQVSDAGLQKLRDIPHLKELHVLAAPRSDDCVPQRITSGGMKSFAALSALDSLELNVPEIDDIGLQDLFALHRLKSLDLSGTFSDSGLSRIGPLKRLDRLALNTNRPITATGIRPLSKLDELRTLTLNAGPLDADAVEALQELPRLESLTFESPKIHRAAFESLPSLKRLKSLSLINVPAGKRELEFVAQLPNLETLRLHSLPIVDRDLEQLKTLTNLKSLELYCQFPKDRLGDDAINAVSKWKNLETLTLRHLNVSDKGIEPLRTMPNLNSFSYEGLKVSDSGIAELQRAMPAVRVLGTAEASNSNSVAH